MGPRLLRAWLKRTGTSQSELSRRIGASVVVVNRYVRGTRLPAGRFLIEMERATDGAVPASSWWPPMKARSWAR